MISNDQYTRLVAYIDSTFKRDGSRQVINIKTNANYDKEDAFMKPKAITAYFPPATPGPTAHLNPAGKKPVFGHQRTWAYSIITDKNLITNNC